MKKILSLIKKPKAELREGFETMQFYRMSDEKSGRDARQIEIYRFYFKGRVVKFRVADVRPHNLGGVAGRLFEIIADSPRAVIWYEAFQRASDGVVFFLGESETQAVAKSMRNREAAYLNRFN